MVRPDCPSYRPDASDSMISPASARRWILRHARAEAAICARLFVRCGFASCSRTIARRCLLGGFGIRSPETVALRVQPQDGGESGTLRAASATDSEDQARPKPQWSAIRPALATVARWGLAASKIESALGLSQLVFAALKVLSLRLRRVARTSVTGVQVAADVRPLVVRAEAGETLLHDQASAARTAASLPSSSLRSATVRSALAGTAATVACAASW